MTPTIGSLCSGYGGLDMAAEALTGGTTLWHCEYDDHPSTLLALRYPGVPNYGDLKALDWTETEVDVLTAGYPCQPFSGAGKRLGTDDPRHLFPYIAQGVERMRPPLLLLENVRGHLSLGFDVVLAELDRIGYDARWTLLRAADVGAPHGRSRLWIAARDRQAGGWPVLLGEPTAVLDEGEWVQAQGGLFGHIAADKPGTAGTMVRGARWDTTADLAHVGGLLPTPRSTAARTGRSSMTRDGQWSAPSLEQALELGRGELPREFRSWDEVPGWQGSLMPTPRTTDANGAGTHGDGGPDLRTVVSLLGTPRASDYKGAGPVGSPSHKHMLERGYLPAQVTDLLPTPTSADSNSSGGSQPEYVTLTDAVVRTDMGTRSNPRHDTLLPTPKATDGTKGGPNQRGSSGDLTLPSAVMPERLALLPTPTTQPQTGNGHARNLGAEVQDLLPTPTSAAGLGGNLSRSGARSDELLLPGVAKQVTDAASWGPYAAAVARWEGLTRPAPPPTEPGRSGPRLSPAFVEWMQGLPTGWVTGADLGLTRNAQLMMLGNGVVPQCAAAAFGLLLADVLPLAVAA